MKISSQNRAKLAQLGAKITQIRAKLDNTIEAIDSTLPKNARILACKKGYKFAKILQFARYERDLLKNNITLNHIFDLSNECDLCAIEAFFKRYNDDKLSEMILIQRFL